MAPDHHRRDVTRRGFLLAGAGGVASAAFAAALPAQAAPVAPAGATPPGGTPTAGAVGDGVAVTVDPASKSSWTVARTVFGRFVEINEFKPYPGVIDQHLANGSFEDWFIKGSNPPWFKKTTVLYEDTPYLPGVAYPWEPVPAGAVSDTADGVEFEMPEGGVHGRRVATDSAVQRFQRVRVQDATGGVRQRLALPDERTLDYDLSLSVRGEGVGAVTVQMVDPDNAVVAETSLDLTTDWVRHEARLRLSRPSPSRYVTPVQGKQVPTQFGEFALVLTVTGTGHVDFDFATLMAGDAVRGKFNPTTLEWLREFGVTSMRWPGGNYTSLYHWQNGIGPWQDRPVTKNDVWGGLDYYYFGLDEYLELCQLVGMDPYVNLGFNTPSGRGEDIIPPEEVARCVEYCNGDITTEMGALRARHGHPAPYHVKQWQVGNEVWGPMQHGHTDAATYAEEFKAYYDAMKAVDPGISVFASGSDVWHLRLGDPPGTPPQWNKIFMDVAGPEYTDGLDLHNYVWGLRNAADRNAFMAAHPELDPVDYNRLLVGYPSGVDKALGILREQARERNIPDLQLTYGEWNLAPGVGPGWPRADRENVAGAAFVAGMYNTFIRHGEALRFGHILDNTIYFRAWTGDVRPLHPGMYVCQLYAEPFLIDGVQWHQADVAIDGPTFDIPEAPWERMMPTPDVPLVDAACLIADHSRRAYVFAVNRDLKNRRAVTVAVPNWPPADAAAAGEAPKVSARMISSIPEHDPFALQLSFTERTAFQVRDLTLTPDDHGKVTVELPPAATIRLQFDAVTPLSR